MSHAHRELQAIDLARFNEVFFDECTEHLAEMERILLSQADGEPGGDQLNALFRAAHSIKGGAGIFGFQDMTIVTHVLESLLDRIRNHEIPFAPAMIDLFLEACDVIAMQLAGHRGGSEVNGEDVDRISRKLQQVIDGEGASDVSVAGADGAAPPAPATAATTRRYHLHFVPDPDIFKRGVRIEGLFTELRELGELTINAELSGTPDLETFDPESCCVCWKLDLITTAREDEIREIFEFVADNNQLTIREVPCGAESAHHGKPEPPFGPGDAACPPESENRASSGGRVPDGQGPAPGANGRRSGEGDSSIRVGVAKVDQLINQVGELVITQAMLAQAASGLDPVRHENLHRTLQQLERNTRSLQQSVMSIRLVPISVVFSRFPRLVRELAAKLGKQARLKTTGDATELDKGLIEKITDPLTHLVRNCMDHALETPQARIAAGKEAIGTIILKASQVGGRIIIDVIDDGAGLDRARILRKAAERGIAASDAMSDEEVWQLIFTPGFSTADTVSDISGRGVGMDVVLKNVQALGGRVHILSEPGKGTRVTISLPLTLAILDGLSVAVGDEKFIIPINTVIESLQPRSGHLKSVSGKLLIRVRDEYIP
ncbi:MAG TPA: ATP-binding protein, partial [Bacteroidota bacterium]